MTEKPLEKPLYNPPIQPEVTAQLTINCVYDRIVTTLQVPFASFEEAERIQTRLAGMIRGENETPFLIKHFAGNTIIANPAKITSMTTTSRLKEDASRLVDTKYTKWLEDEIERLSEKEKIGIGL